MPTNVPPPYRAAEARYRAATTPEDKLEALEEMLRIMPKHKGTDKLQADVKARIARLRKQPTTSAGARAAGHTVSREGAGQIALVGPPNSGKSSLLASLTHAEPKIGDFPFTTREPQPGMAPYRDVALQLVDLPPVSREHVEAWVYDLVRRADLLWLVLAAETCLEGWEETRALLEDKRILPHPPGRVPEPEDPRILPRPALLVVTGADRPGAAETVETFRELEEDLDLPLCLVSGTTGTGLPELLERSFLTLDVMRIYTKEPGKPADRKKPFTLPVGSTLEDLARVIHNELADQLRFAKVWGTGVFDGQQVQRDHILHDGDVVELHAS